MGFQPHSREVKHDPLAVACGDGPGAVTVVRVVARITAITKIAARAIDKTLTFRDLPWAADGAVRFSADGFPANGLDRGPVQLEAEVGV